MTNLHIQITVHNIISSWGGLKCMYFWGEIQLKCISVVLLALYVDYFFSTFQHSYFAAHTSAKINYKNKNN